MGNFTIDTYDKIAHNYAEKHWTTGFWAKQHTDFEGFLQGKKVLDAGCGPGRETAYFVSRGYDVLGIDASGGMIDEAQKRVPKGNFLKMDMTNLALEEHSFDGVWCCASLLHLNSGEASKALVGFARILKKDGILFVSVKQGDGEIVKQYSDGTKRYYKYYTIEEATELVGRYFEILKAYTHRDDEEDTWISVFAKNPRTF